MIWMSYRQFRSQAITTTAILLALATALVATGPHLVSLYEAAGLNSCRANCASLAGNFISNLSSGIYAAVFYTGIVAMYLTPALAGIFWGAPLVTREFEAGTLPLAWKQSITRTRWIVTKLGLGGLAAIAASGLLSLMISWWASPVDHALAIGNQASHLSFNRLSPLMFGARGIAPLGYAALAFTLGVTVGVLVRRMLPAMAITLVIFAAVQVAMPSLVRPHLIPPVRAAASLNVTTAGLLIRSVQGSPTTGQMTVIGNFAKPGAWILSDQTITPSGAVFTGPATEACLGNSAQACSGWLAGKHLRQLVTYQPASRFWPLQWIETAIYLVLATGLSWLCIWQIRRRQS
ncbi:MAG: ABC transporter permease [Streptosporangiaceae bacterium]